MGLRALTGFMSGWKNASDADRAQMLEEMKFALGVPGELARTAATRQQTGIAASQEERAQRLFGPQYQQAELITQTAQQSLEDAKRKARFEQQVEPYLFAREREGAQQARIGTLRAGTEQQYFPRAEATRVEQLESTLASTNLELQTLRDQVARAETARLGIQAQYGVTPEFAAMEREITGAQAQTAEAKAAIDWKVADLEAKRTVRTAEFETELVTEKSRQKIAPEMVGLMVDEMRANVEALRAKAKGAVGGGVDVLKYRNDMLKSMLDAEQTIARLKAGVSLEEAERVLGPDSAIIALMRITGDPVEATKALEKWLNSARAFMYYDFGIKFREIIDSTTNQIKFDKLPVIDPGLYLQFYPQALGAREMMLGIDLGLTGAAPPPTPPTGPTRTPAPGVSTPTRGPAPAVTPPAPGPPPGPPSASAVSPLRGPIRELHDRLITPAPTTQEAPTQETPAQEVWNQLNVEEIIRRLPQLAPQQ